MSNKLWDKRQQNFQESIKLIRMEAGLTQVELANSLQKPQSYVSKYERGERKLSYLEVLDICKVCNIPPQQFNQMLEPAQ